MTTLPKAWNVSSFRLLLSFVKSPVVVVNLYSLRLFFP